MNADGSGQTRLTTNNAQDVRPRYADARPCTGVPTDGSDANCGPSRHALAYSDPNSDAHGDTDPRAHSNPRRVAASGQHR